MELLKSAAKIVFLMMTIAVIAGLFIGKVDQKDFMTLASMVFTFYFATKLNDSNSAETFGGK